MVCEKLCKKECRGRGDFEKKNPKFVVFYSKGISNRIGYYSNVLKGNVFNFKGKRNFFFRLTFTCMKMIKLIFFFIICMPFFIQETRCEKFDKQVFDVLQYRCSTTMFAFIITICLCCGYFRLWITSCYYSFFFYDN